MDKNTTSRPGSAASTASTASILSNGEIVPRRKRVLPAVNTSAAASASTVGDVSHVTANTESKAPAALESETKVAALSLQDLIKFANKRITTDGFSESPEQFLRRLPPSTTTVDQVGDWIWVSNPHFDQSSLPSPDIETFMMKGDTLLRDFDTYKEDIKTSTSKVHGAQAMIKKRREELPSALKNLATEHNVTHGKWMLFPSADNVDSTWLRVVQGVVEGKLGTAAKIAPGRPDYNRNRLIAIYTKDFSDLEDVKRVLVELKDRNLVGGDRAPIYYKADAWTYLGIESKNKYGLQASLYSSKDML